MVEAEECLIPTMPPDDICAGARIMARLINCIPEKDRDYSAVFDALVWIHQHDHPDLWLPANVRDLVESTVKEVRHG